MKDVSPTDTKYIWRQSLLRYNTENITHSTNIYLIWISSFSQFIYNIDINLS